MTRFPFLHTLLTGQAELEAERQRAEMWKAAYAAAEAELSRVHAELAAKGNRSTQAQGRAYRAAFERTTAALSRSVQSGAR